MTNLPPKRHRRTRTSRTAPSLTLEVSYVWHDANGEEHITDAEGLPSELKGPDGRPQLPRNHPVWEIVHNSFREALSKRMEAAGGSPIGWDLYFLLWEREAAKMKELYSAWLGARSDAGK